ncbi:MAG: DUF1598 domain-containing protein, partial [Planctomycetales bacterium]|nr:DUF1598 domain-containing protein [Planctomycetales bacterium]
YVFVYPEQNDIVLAGPAEAWRKDDLGNPVGVTSGQAVVRLEYFLAALRAAFDPNPHAISCSIEPLPEGVRQMQAYLEQIAGDRRAAENPDRVAHEIEQRLGLQEIKLTGIDPTTRFAGVLVASDYRMKRLAMGFEPSPVKGMPSYVDMIRNPHATNMMPRWWIEDDYQALLTDDAGLAWQLQGRGVKVLTEDELVAADGTRQATGKVSPLASKWAETMTEKYDQLAAKSPVFGDLRNCMDAAVIAALIANEKLHVKAGLELGDLLNPGLISLAQQPVPRHVPSRVSYRLKRRHLVLTASGGVQIRATQVAGRHQPDGSLAARRDDAARPAQASWWWD